MDNIQTQIALFLQSLPDNITKVNGRWLYDGKWLFSSELVKEVKR